MHRKPLRPAAQARRFPELGDIVFDPHDNGHTRWLGRQERGGVALVLLRSLQARLSLPKLCPWPALPCRQDLDLEAPPGPAQKVPVVTFCGIGRPAERRRMLNLFEGYVGLDVRMVRRRTFSHPDKATYQRLMRECHFALCPRGQGLYSCRFYEALAAGRIPVLLRGHQHVVAPPALRDAATIIEAEEPADVVAAWDGGLRETWEEVSRANRQAWLDYASPLGAALYVADLIRSEALSPCHQP